ncbi:MAG: hypothetical protein ABJB34_05890 [Acidobacteriota bacterium]
MILGLLLAAGFEAPRYFNLKNVADAEHYTGLKVWTAIPPLLSEQEIAKGNRRHIILVLVGTIGAIASIPVLVVVLNVLRVFERFG